MNSIAPEIARATLPPNWDAAQKKKYLQRSFKLRDAGTGFSDMGTQYKKALFTLMTVVGLVLLIACANIANLLLARSTARQREISIRLAIGAARSRVVRQLLTESLLLAFVGAAGGLVFSVWGSRLLLRLLSTSNSELQLDLAPDLHLLAFTAGIAVLTGILFGLAPALRATRTAPNQVLKENARGTHAGSSRFTLGKALVTSQVALSLTLLVGAGLFLGTLRNLLTLDPGFNRHNVLLVKAGLPETHIPKPMRGPLFEKILLAARELHGVRSASNSDMTPISHMFWNEEVHPEGYQAKPVEDDTLVYFNRVSPRYFETMGTPMLMGRDFSSRDTPASPKVIIIAESAARHFWGTANPIGKTIAMDRNGPPPRQQDVFEVIGLVKDAKYGQLSEKTLKTAYVPFSQDLEPRPQTNYELRFEGPSEALMPSVRTAIAAVNPDVSLEFSSLEVQVNDSLIQPRIVALLGSFFGFLALLLAMIGLYGVLSYTAAQRRGEIGIRMALGAAQNSVIWLILRDVLIMLAVGLMLGAAASLAAGRLVGSLLYGMKPTDPMTLALAATVLGICAAFAGYLPARRASRMDPMAALRDE
jgi:predicted permease